MRPLFEARLLFLSKAPAFASKQIKQTSLAFGPQHPAAHGILKLQLYLSGETIR